jgi:hypothetical protein
MTKKRKLVVLAVAGVGLLAGPLLYLFALSQTPFQAKYAQVRQGMTVGEVHAILGEPNWASKTPPIHHGSILVEIKVAGNSPDVANWVLCKEEYCEPGCASTKRFWRSFLARMRRYTNPTRERGSAAEPSLARRVSVVRQCSHQKPEKPFGARVGPSFLIPPESRETAYVFFANGRVTRKDYVEEGRHWPKVFQAFFDLIGQ